MLSRVCQILQGLLQDLHVLGIAQKIVHVPSPNADVLGKGFSPRQHLVLGDDRIRGQVTRAINVQPTTQSGHVSPHHHDRMVFSTRTDGRHQLLCGVHSIDAPPDDAVDQYNVEIIFFDALARVGQCQRVLGAVVGRKHVFDRGVDVHCDVIGGDVEMVQNEDLFLNGVPLLTNAENVEVGPVLVVGLVVNNGRDQHTVQIFSIRQRSECQQRTVMGSSVVDQWQVAMGAGNEGILPHINGGGGGGGVVPGLAGEVREVGGDGEWKRGGGGVGGWIGWRGVDGEEMNGEKDAS